MVPELVKGKGSRVALLKWRGAQDAVGLSISFASQQAVKESLFLEEERLLCAGQGCSPSNQKMCVLARWDVATDIHFTLTEAELIPSLKSLVPGSPPHFL